MGNGTNTPISTIEILREYLQTAMEIEHATIPVYLSTLYSIKTGKGYINRPAEDAIRTVVKEEMLHLTLAANMLNAINGTPDLLRPDFVPSYPARLPTGEDRFDAELLPFSEKALDVFLQIESPSEPTGAQPFLELDGVRYIKHEDLRKSRKRGVGMTPHFHTRSPAGQELHLHFWSIGDFYRAVLNGFEALYQKMGNALFCGQPDRQINPTAYFSAGGELSDIRTIEDVRKAINLISTQGEGFGDRIRDDEGELAHYYRFMEIRKGRHYRQDENDEPDKDNPTGPPFPVDWNEAYPIIPNAKVAMYRGWPDIHEAALKFNRRYRTFLEKLNRGFNGHSKEFRTIFKDMMGLRDDATRLIRNSLPSGQGNAAPTYEMDQLAPE